MTHKRVFFSVSVPECSYKYRDCRKCLTECENGKYHKVSVVLQQTRSVKFDDQNYCISLKLAIALCQPFSLTLKQYTFLPSFLSFTALQSSCTLSFLFSLIPSVRIEDHHCQVYSFGSAGCRGDGMCA